jgi:hypothetical protein
MAKGGKRTVQKERERDAADHAAHGQSRALGDTGDGQTGVDSAHQGISNRPADRGEDRPGGEGPQRTAGAGKEEPQTEAGVPPAQHQERESLDNPSQSGRPRDEGEDRIERTGAQKSPRSDPEAVRPPGSPRPDDNTL